MNFMVKIVGAFLAQRQTFCRFATFPLTGESPVCPPAGRSVKVCILNQSLGREQTSALMTGASPVTTK